MEDLAFGRHLPVMDRLPPHRSAAANSRKTQHVVTVGIVAAPVAITHRRAQPWLLRREFRRGFASARLKGPGGAIILTISWVVSTRGATQAQENIRPARTPSSVRRAGSCAKRAFSGSISRAGHRRQRLRESVQPDVFARQPTKSSAKSTQARPARRQADDHHFTAQFLFATNCTQLRHAPRK